MGHRHREEGGKGGERRAAQGSVFMFHGSRFAERERERGRGRDGNRERDRDRDRERETERERGTQSQGREGGRGRARDERDIAGRVWAQGHGRAWGHRHREGG